MVPIKFRGHFKKSKQRIICVGSRIVSVKERNDGFEENEGGKVRKTVGMWEGKKREKSWRTAPHSSLGQPESAGSGVGVRKGDAEFSFRNDESEVPIGPPCEYGRLDSGYYSLKRKSGWE